jgi:hypothetical protein
VLATAATFDVRFSITARQDKRVRAAIDPMPDDAWQPIPYWLSPDPPLSVDRRRPAERANALLPGTMTLLGGKKSPDRRAPAECEQTTI